MSLRNSPKIVSNGLVFYYDMGNAQKSWKGKPTVNKHTNADTLSGWSFNDSSYSNGRLIAGTSSAAHWVLQDTAVTTGVTYTQSVEVKYDGVNYFQIAPSNGFFNTFVAFDLITGTIAGGNDAAATITPTTDGYYKCTYTAAATATVSGRMAFGPNTSNTTRLGAWVGNGTNGVYLRNPQLEESSFATPFVNGTRSNTQALVDLTGQNTITASSLTYNSDGSFSFDGQTTYADAVFSSTITLKCLEFWWYNNYLINNTDSAQGSSGGQPYQCVINFNRGASTTPGVNLSGWTGSATNESIHIWGDTVGNGANYYGMTYIRDAVPVGWHQVVFNWNGSSYDIWVDGTKRTAYASSLGHAGLTILNSCRIGRDSGGSYYFDGKIASIKIYNVELTDSQVSQNFNALRGRYGV